MDEKLKKDIDNIVWWIPFKKLRNSVRNYLLYINSIEKRCIELQTNINNNLNKIDKYIVNNPYFEMEIIKNFRIAIKNDHQFINKYMKLIKGLDENSKIILEKIISRISNYINIDDYPTFSQNEEKLFSDTYYEHIAKKIKINNNCYLYDNKYFLPLDIFESQIFFENYGIEQNINNLIYLKNKAIMDVGAYIGDSSIVLSKYTYNKVYAFEPMPYNYDLMLKTIELNNINNIVPVNIALGDENKKLYVDKYDNITYLFPNTYTTEYDNEKVAIQMKTLDQFVEENNITVGLIKTDLEGFEQDFLKGAINSIKKYKPILMISIYHNYKDFFEIKPMIDILNLGYKFKIYKSKTKFTIIDTMLIAEI